MDALLIALLATETAILASVLGFAFRQYGQLQRAIADGAGWRQSYDREHETTERYRKAEDQAAMQSGITNAVLSALGKLPKDGGT